MFIYIFILNFGAVWRRVVSFMPRSLYSRYPLCKRLGETQRWPGLYGLHKPNLHPVGIEPRFLGHPSRSLVIILPTLFGLLKIHNTRGNFVVVIYEWENSFSRGQSELRCAVCHEAFGLGNRNVFQECNEGLLGTAPVSEYFISSVISVSLPILFHQRTQWPSPAVRSTYPTSLPPPEAIIWCVPVYTVYCTIKLCCVWSYTHHKAVVLKTSSDLKMEVLGSPRTFLHTRLHSVGPLKTVISVYLNLSQPSALRQYFILDATHFHGTNMFRTSWYVLCSVPCL